MLRMVDVGFALKYTVIGRRRKSAICSNFCDPPFVNAIKNLLGVHARMCVTKSGLLDTLQVDQSHKSNQLLGTLNDSS